eukprot:1252825-Pyramimonas_sp.AAC.2
MSQQCSRHSEMTVTFSTPGSMCRSGMTHCKHVAAISVFRPGVAHRATGVQGYKMAHEHERAWAERGAVVALRIRGRAHPSDGSEIEYAYEFQGTRREGDPDTAAYAGTRS